MARADKTKKIFYLKFIRWYLSKNPDLFSKTGYKNIDRLLSSSTNLKRLFPEESMQKNVYYALNLKKTPVDNTIKSIYDTFKIPIDFDDFGYNKNINTNPIYRAFIDEVGINQNLLIEDSESNSKLKKEEIDVVKPKKGSTRLYEILEELFLIETDLHSNNEVENLLYRSKEYLKFNKTELNSKIVDILESVFIFNNNDPLVAIDQINRCILFFKEEDIYLHNLCKLIASKFYIETGKFKIAKQLLKSIGKYFVNQHDLIRATELFNYSGDIALLNDLPDRAISNYLIAIEYSENLLNTNKHRNTAWYVAIINFKLGEVYLNELKLSASKIRFGIACKSFVNLNMNTYLFLTYIRISDILFELNGKNDENWKVYLNKAISHIDDILEDKLGSIHILVLIDLLILTNQNQFAIDLISKIESNLRLKEEISFKIEIKIKLIELLLKLNEIQSAIPVKNELLDLLNGELNLSACIVIANLIILDNKNHEFKTCINEFISKINLDLKSTKEIKYKVECYITCAALYNMLQMYEEAIDCYKGALALVKISTYKYWVIQSDLAIIYIKSEKILEAEEIFQQIVSNEKHREFSGLYIKGLYYLAIFGFDKKGVNAKTKEQILELDKIRQKYNIKDKQFEKLLNTFFATEYFHLSQGINFEKSITRLYEGINKTEIEQIDSFIRLWYYKNDISLSIHLTNKVGLKALLFCDELRILNSLSEKLNWLFDYFVLQPELSKFLKRFEIIKFPFEDFWSDDEIFLYSFEMTNQLDDNQFYNYIARVIDSRFNAKDEKQRNYSGQLILPIHNIDNQIIEHILCGYTIELNSIVYEFIKDNSANSILGGNCFVFNGNLGDKCTIYDKILISIRFNSIPIFLNKDLESILEKRAIVDRIRIRIPYHINTSKDLGNRLKLLFVEYFYADFNHIKSSGIKLKNEIESSNIHFNEFIEVEIIILKYFNDGLTQYYPVISLFEAD